MAVPAALGVPVSPGPGLPQVLARLPGWEALPSGLSPGSRQGRAVPCRARSGRAGPGQRCRPAPGTRCLPALAVSLREIHLHLAPWSWECAGQRGSPAGKRCPGLPSSSVSLQRLTGRWVKAASPGHGTRCFQVSELPPPPGAIPAQRTKRPRNQPLEQRDGKDRMGKGPSQGDGRGCVSPQRWLIAPAASTEQLCHTGGSHGARLRSTLCVPSIGLLIIVRGAGA